MPNLFVILVLFIGLFASRTMGTAYGVAIGVVLDFLLGNKIGIYAGLWSAEGEEIEEDMYFCYDLVTKQLKKEEKNDPEMFYRYIKNSK